MNTKVEIMVNGKPVKQYNHDGNTYVEARNGTEYSVKIRNNSYGRKLAVITVDGLNVITGEPQGNDIGRGYIVDSYSAITIKGFRKDMESVGAFKFCRKDKSYCNKQGLEGNNGVIGVRIYKEKAKPILYCTLTSTSPMWPPLGSNHPDITYKGSFNSPFLDASPSLTCKEIDNSLRGGTLNCDTACYASNVCSTSNATPDFDIGTTWGKEHHDAVREEEFDPVSYGYDEHIIYYDTKRNLKDIGIVFEKVTYISHPKAFGNFAKPPKGWRG